MMNTLKIAGRLINLNYYYFAEAEIIPYDRLWEEGKLALKIKLVPIIGVETEPVNIYIEDYPENWKEIIEVQLNKMDSVR